MFQHEDMKDLAMKKNRILLIDDDRSLLITVGDFLKFEGYNVTTADSGEQGLECLKEMEPDIIILDMSMPGMGGVGFLKEISSIEGEPSHPVLVLTARANMEDFFSGINVAGFLSKPCAPDQLVTEVSRIIMLSGVSRPVESVQARRKVLIAEDDEVLNDAIVSAFAGVGYVVETVFNGPDVLEKAIIEKPDVVVVKLVLANMNGDAVASTLSAIPSTSDIPVVLYDDFNMQDSEKKVLTANRSIKKFVRTNRPKDLLAAVELILS